MNYADSLTDQYSSFRLSNHSSRMPAFRRAIDKVAALPCDVLLTQHPDASRFSKKVERRESDADVAPLIDTTSCRAYAAEATRRLDERLVQELQTTN